MNGQSDFSLHRMSGIYTIRFKGVLATFCVALVATTASAGDAPAELGRIHWIRGFESARRLAEKDGKPLLVLFQEVPGCSTCVNYGQNVLSHPLLVEAAETLFVPVAVYNNVSGDDAKTLEEFGEPAWNNPVVRIVAADRAALAPRLANDYSVGGLAGTMIAALRRGGRDVPAYLALVAEEYASRASNLERATFAMHCFWEGEIRLGALKGVIATRPGFVNGEEVVEIEFDSKRLPFAELHAGAAKVNCASRVYARNPAQAKSAAAAGAKVVSSDEPIRPDKEPKYYLSRTPYRALPMTELQACRVNAALGNKTDPDTFLSPRQLELVTHIKARPKADWPVLIGAQDLVKAWETAERTSGSLGP